MKLILRYCHHDPSNSLSSLIREHFDAIGKKRPVDEARIVVERRMEGSPPFRISVHLVTPGPDLFAESVEHTFRAALRKVVEQIEAELSRRSRKRMRNQRSSAAKLRSHRLVHA